MTRTITLVLALGLAVPVMAQDPAPEPQPKEVASAEAPAKAEPAANEEQQPAQATDTVLMPTLSKFATRNVVIGAGGRSEDTDSSKFLEYRSYPNGAVLPYLRFFGQDKLLYDISARNALQDDAVYSLRLEKDWFGLRANVVRIPHNFGNSAVSALQDLGDGVFKLPDPLQQQNQSAIAVQHARSPSSVNYAFLNGLATGLIAGTERSSVGLQRDRGLVEFSLTRNQPIDLKLAYFYEDRSGNRGSGTSFGFGNVVETPEPIEYRTHDVSLNAEWAQSWGLVRGGVRFNKFDNRILVQSFDNPWRVTDSTHPSAYQSPGSASIDGPSFARLALPPSNDAITGTLGFSVKFAGNSRLMADASYGQWTQDEQLIPFTSNSAITVPFRATDPSHLPAQSLDGQIDTTTLSAMFSTRPVKGLNLSARYRRYDLDNKTPRIEFEEGYARFDAVWEDIPRITVPYSYTNDNAQLTAGYDFRLSDTASLGLEAGYKYDKMARTFREAAHTTQNSLFGAVNLRASDWMILRGTIETGSRDYEDLEILHSEEASFLEEGTPANLLAIPDHSTNPTLQATYASFRCESGAPCNVRYDQSSRDLWRANAMLQLMPGGNTSFAFTYVYGKDDYSETNYGLVDTETWAFNAEVDYTPSERFNVFAFYGKENITNFQRGRQSGSTVSARQIDDWTSSTEDKVDSYGGGINLALAKDNKADVSLFGTYQTVDGFNDLDAPVGGLPWQAKQSLGGILDIEDYDDTKLLTLTGEVGYKLDNAWKVSLGGIYEEYDIDDAFSTGLQYYMPASYFLNGNDQDYKGGSIYLKVSYLW